MIDESNHESVVESPNQSDEAGGEDYLQEEEMRPGYWLLELCRDIFPGSPAPFAPPAEAEGAG